MPDPIVAALFTIQKRLAISTIALAVFVGCATSTITLAELTGRLPRRRPQRERVQRFVEKYRTAQKRSDLRLEDLAVSP